MPKEYSPFTPGIPAPKELFVGREKEIERLRSSIAKAAKGHLQVAFLSGERGMGKSSLASFVKLLAERDLNVLGIHAFLGGVTTVEEMVRRIFDRLLKDSVDRQWDEKIKDFFGEHIKQVGLFGVSVEFKASQSELQQLAGSFAPSLRNLLKKLKGEQEALFIILDDINGLANSLEFANWLKSFVDEIATGAEPLPLCLLTVGYEERRQSLIKLQPSIARIFELYDLKIWSDDETTCFYQNAFEKVNIPIDKEALGMMVDFTSGLPVFAHEIGDAVFKRDADNFIDSDDALDGIKFAAEIIGGKFLETQVFQAFQKSIYLPILDKIVTHMPKQFKRLDILKVLRENEKKNLDNFLRSMVKKGFLSRIGEGEYKFASQLYSAYFYMRLKGSLSSNA